MTRRHIDMTRLREAQSGPGSDTRTWVALARVDDEDGSVRWDDELGWLVDVTFQGGELDQDGPVPCRVGQVYAQGGEGKVEPPGPGCVVVVVIPEGNVNVDPVIVGTVYAADCSAPAISDPEDAHYLRTSLGVDEKIGGDVRREVQGDISVESGGDVSHVANGSLDLVGSLVNLGSAGAGEAYLLGSSFATQFQAYLTAVIALCDALITAHGPMGPYPDTGTAAAAATLKTQATTLSVAMVPGNLLSSTVFGV